MPRSRWLRRGTTIGMSLFLLVSAGFAAEEPPKSSKYQTTGDGATIAGLTPIKVEGLGFVMGLKGTGSNPPPNNYRSMTIEMMKKRGVDDAVKWIESEDTAIVLLRAFIPPGIRKGDPIDVEVWIPPGDDATSLKGGFLLEAELKEQFITKKGTLPGNTLVKVDGPVLVIVDPNASEDEREASLRKGRVLGRGRCMIDRDFRLVLENGKQSKSLSRRIAFRINQRFRAPSAGAKGVANPVDYQSVNFRLAPEYRHNIERYLHVVRRIPLSESKSFEDRLLGVLETELMEPELAIEASLRLEALGAEAIPTLQEGLTSKHDLVRFCSAQALAYLNDSSGFKVLADLADRSNAYRAHALAAFVAHDQPLARSHLARLLNSQSSEARYGAFRSLWILDPRDSLVRSVSLGPDQFALHAVETKGPPMVHVARSFRREIVLFEPQQRVLTPLNLRAGDNIIVTASAGSDEVHLASFQPAAGGPKQDRRIASLCLGDIITQAADLGATYPDIVDLLMQASSQGNLSARLEINALPKAMALDTLQAIESSDDARRWQAFQPRTPNLFDSGSAGGNGSSPASGRLRENGLGENGLREAGLGETLVGDETEQTSSSAPAESKARWWQRGILRGNAN